VVLPGDARARERERKKSEREKERKREREIQGHTYMSICIYISHIGLHLHITYDCIYISNMASSVTEASANKLNPEP
jgi:hypothetical protein